METPNISKTTLISHIYNEEYLLPFWLQHHKDMFDNIIIIDYHSTDRSVEICKTICPKCTIITSRNNCFGAQEVDKEVMEIETRVEGIKIALNTTEFLLCVKPITEIFAENYMYPISYNINCFSPYTHKIYDINHYNELFSHLLDEDVRYHCDRGTRQMHNYKNGNYNVGRHSTHNVTISTDNAFIIWVGHFPLNELQMKRKLQIQSKIPKHDKDVGFGFQHLFSKEKIFEINSEKCNTGQKLMNINPVVYDMVCKICKNM